LQQQLREMIALNKVSAAAVKATDLDEFIWSATLAVQETLHPDNCGVFLLDEDRQRWKPHRSYQGTNQEHLAESYPVSEGIVGKVLTSEKMARVPDVSREPFYREAMPGIQSEICVPIMVAGRVFGCLNAESIMPGAFSEHDEHLLRTMADSMSLAIEKIRLLKMEQQRREEAEMLYATTHDLVIDHDLSTLLQTIVLNTAMVKASEQALHANLNASAARLTSVQNWIMCHQYGERGNRCRKGKPVIISDYRNWENRSPVYRDRNTIVAVLSVPIRWQDRVIGVINIFENDKPRRFREEDVSIVTSFANQAAIAIENARLFEEEHRRRRKPPSPRSDAYLASLQLDVV
jgi:GAF domain-containing protein